MSSSLLMPRQNKVEMFRVVDGIEDGEDGSSWVAKDVFHIWQTRQNQLL